jgi:hypothetical protein
MPSMRISSFVATIAVAGTLAVIANAQEQKAPSSGIFVETVGSQAEVRLPSTRFDTKETGIGKSMATMGFTKPQMQGALAGPRAYTRVAGDATFRVQLSEQSASDPQNMSPTDMMGMMGMMNGGDGSIPPMAKGPQDFALVKLTVADENREAHFGSPGASRPKDAVDVAVEILGPQAFRVKPKHPLPPGEYAFYVRMGNAPMGPAWDFGVDQK